MLTSRGRVRTWHGDEGWGVVDAEATPGGCWFHVSAVLAGGRSLAVGEEVAFTWEVGAQDGFDHRALEVWPADGEPDRSHVHVHEGPSSAYGSMLSLRFDDPDGHPAP